LEAANNQVRFWHHQIVIKSHQISQSIYLPGIG